MAVQFRLQQPVQDPISHITIGPILWNSPYLSKNIGEKISGIACFGLN